MPVADPSDKLDYSVNWGAKVLGSGETIATSTWTVPVGLTSSDESHTTTVATVWLTGGTAGESYTVTNHITTNQGREFERSFPVNTVDL